MKKATIFFIILTCLSLQSLVIKPIRAESATQSAESQTEKIKERLEKTAKEDLETVKGELEKKATAPRKKAYIGTVKTIDSSGIVLEYRSQTYHITFIDSTEFVKSSGQAKLSLEGINPDDFIIAMGFVSPDSESLSAHRILLIASPKPPASRQLIIGKIKEIDGTKVSVDGKTLTITSKTNLKIKGIEDPTIEDLELEDNLFAIVTLDSNGDIDEINSILVLPGRHNPASQEPTNLEATESAAATESATETEETE